MVAPYYAYLIDDPVVGENKGDTSDTLLDSESGMESLSTPLPMEEVQSPEDIQNDDQVQSMLHVFCIVYCI